jgi:hypothetical protein
MKPTSMRLTIAFLVFLSLSGCASVASFQGNSQAWDVHVQPESPFVLDADTTLRFADTTFGRYSFRIARDGEDVVYGILPMDFHNERVYWDILFPPMGV